METKQYRSNAVSQMEVIIIIIQHNSNVLQATAHTDTELCCAIKDAMLLRAFWWDQLMSFAIIWSLASKNDVDSFFQIQSIPLLNVKVSLNIHNVLLVLYKLSFMSVVTQGLLGEKVKLHLLTDDRAD